ncbi:MAG: LptA/OstA family protein, partial [Planctomycetota bacterium]
MNDVGRKIVVGVVSFGAILAVYLVYSRFNETPPIGFDKAIETSSPADANVASLEAEVGMVGNVGIGTVRNAKFVAMNDDKEVEREFGFEKLLHESGSQWGLEKPFINIFRDNFKIYITADKGDIRLESDTSTPMPADGALTGNVVVRIEAQKGDNLEESFLYFDDIVFVGEKSRFSTNGPIKFVSQDTRMSGKGLELIYNEQSQRIELLKINKLDSLKMKTSNETSLFSSDESKADQVKSQNQQSAKPESPKVT